jgi:hypothetical protein
LEGKFSFFDKIDRIKNPRINGSLCMIPSSYVHHFQFEICWTKFLSFDTIEGQNRKSLTKTKIQFDVLGGPVGIEEKILQSFPMFGIPQTNDLPDASASDSNTLPSAKDSLVNGVIRDSKGRLVFCYKVGKMIVDELVEYTDEEKFHRYTIWRFEHMVKLLGETLESKTGADKWVLLFDLEGFSMSKHAKRSVVNVIKGFNGLGASCYRETVAQIYIINAPKVFSLGYSMIHPFLNSRTRKKIIMSNGKGDDVSEYLDISKRLPCVEN